MGEKGTVTRVRGVAAAPCRQPEIKRHTLGHASLPSQGSKPHTAPSITASPKTLPLPQFSEHSLHAWEAGMRAVCCITTTGTKVQFPYAVWLLLVTVHSVYTADPIYP